MQAREKDKEIGDSIGMSMSVMSGAGLTWLSAPPGTRCNRCNASILPKHPTAIPRGTLARCGSESPEKNDLASEFARLVNETGMQQHSPQQPSHLLSPTAAVAAVLDALQRKDWPSSNAGISVAFAFTKPQPEEGTTPASAPPSRPRRSWAATERWLDLKSFQDELTRPPYMTLLEFDSWRAASPLVFPSSRNEGRAVQAVVVQQDERDYAFSFCMERSQTGSLRGCWLVTGVRQGDYGSV